MLVKWEYTKFCSQPYAQMLNSIQSVPQVWVVKEGRRRHRSMLDCKIWDYSPMRYVKHSNLTGSRTNETDLPVEIDKRLENFQKQKWWFSWVKPQYSKPIEKYKGIR